MSHCSRKFATEESEDSSQGGDGGPRIFLAWNPRLKKQISYLAANMSRGQIPKPYDGHGDVIQIVNESGTIVNRYSYDEWGNIRSKTENISNPLKYAGEYYDDESGLYYLRARYYDPVIGRFITRDTYEGDISNPLSLNSYSYCYNNPLIYADPSGHYVDYASEAARMNIAQTGAWKDTVDQRLSDIGNKYMGGITDLDQIVSILQTVPTTTNGNYSTSEAVTYQPSPSSSTNPDKISSAAKPTGVGKETKQIEAQVMPTGTSQKTGILNAIIDAVTSKEASSTVSIVGGSTATIAFIGATIGAALPFAATVVGIASVASMAMATISILQSTTRILRGDSSLYEEGLNIGVNALGFATGIGSIGFNSFNAVTNQNVGKALSFLYSRTLSVFGGVTGLGELVAR